DTRLGSSPLRVELRDARADRLELLPALLERRAIALRELRHVLVGGVAFGLLLLDLHDEAAPLRGNVRDGIEPLDGRRRTPAKGLTDLVEVISDVTRVEHARASCITSFGDACG